MIQYPPGREPDFWDPVPSESTHRFALGYVAQVTRTAPPLVALCMNPSHAGETQSDRTINRLIRASDENGYAGWVMLNLYPDRSPDPHALRRFDPHRSGANKLAIAVVLAKFGSTEVLGAWGDPPNDTLRRAKLDVLALLSNLRVRVFTFDPLTRKGNPRHPNPRGRELLLLGPKQYVT